MVWCTASPVIQLPCLVFCVGTGLLFQSSLCRLCVSEYLRCLTHKPAMLIEQAPSSSRLLLFTQVHSSVYAHTFEEVVLQKRQIT